MNIICKKSESMSESIISRIQGNETEIEKLIDIRDENGEFRSTYDILRDLSNLFKASTKEKQDEIANLIEEIREEMTKEYHKRIDEAISKCGDNYDESKSLMYIF